MALFYEPTDQCAQKVLDGADIVRDAIFRQLRHSARIGWQLTASELIF